MKTISREQLKKLLAEVKPDNKDRHKGYALVYVLDYKSYLDEHIPGSINIVRGHEAEFERHFDKAKEIIVYCESRECGASGSVAQTLGESGFENVIEYEGGMLDWKSDGNQLERGGSKVQEMYIA